MSCSHSGRYLRSQYPWYALTFSTMLLAPVVMATISFSVVSSSALMMEKKEGGSGSPSARAPRRGTAWQTVRQSRAASCTMLSSDCMVGLSSQCVLRTSSTIVALNTGTTSVRASPLSARDSSCSDRLMHVRSASSARLSTRCVYRRHSCRTSSPSPSKISCARASCSPISAAAVANRSRAASRCARCAASNSASPYTCFFANCTSSVSATAAHSCPMRALTAFHAATCSAASPHALRASRTKKSMSRLFDSHVILFRPGAMRLSSVRVRSANSLRSPGSMAVITALYSRASASTASRCSRNCSRRALISWIATGTSKRSRPHSRASSIRPRIVLSKLTRSSPSDPSATASSFVSSRCRTSIVMLVNHSPWRLRANVPSDCCVCSNAAPRSASSGACGSAAACASR